MNIAEYLDILVLVQFGMLQSVYQVKMFGL